MSRTSRWFLAAMLIAAPLVAGDEFNKNMSGTVPYRGGRVMIVHRFGSVRVHTTTANEVTARATVHSSDAELGKMFRFSVTNTDDGVVVRTSVPQFHMRGDEDGSWSADVEVTVPERAPVLLRNSFGSIEVTGLRAPAEIINRQGSIDAKDIRGGRIETAFGSINLEGSEGDTTLRNANGAINASDVRGQLTITNRFGSVTVRSVDKGLSIANSNAAVSAVDVKGPTSISNSFASTEA
ncbi:MAG TPA: hypothetical protein VL284_16385, partial [Thermoanaerobaculia bacterium]|nr:hypothetical protein [Thermoanaerobaculia bacterium]